jgi:hypothetical protein
MRPQEILLIQLRHTTPRPQVFFSSRHEAQEAHIAVNVTTMRPSDILLGVKTYSHEAFFYFFIFLYSYHVAEEEPHGRERDHTRVLVHVEVGQVVGLDA